MNHSEKRCRFEVLYFIVGGGKGSKAKKNKLALFIYISLVYLIHIEIEYIEYVRGNRKGKSWLLCEFICEAKMLTSNNDCLFPKNTYFLTFWCSERCTMVSGSSIPYLSGFLFMKWVIFLSTWNKTCIWKKVHILGKFTCLWVSMSD